MKKKIIQIAGITIFFVVCFIIGIGLGKFITSNSAEGASGWDFGVDIFISLIMLYLAFFLQIIIHEGGHMVAAMIRGWKFISFMVAGFVLSKSCGKYSFSRFKIAGAGGQCIMCPPECGDTDKGIMLYNAGGVIANIATSLLALVPMLVWYDSIPNALKIFLGSMIVIGIFFAVVNGIPTKAGGLPNDGMNMLNLRKDSFATQVFMESLRIQSGMVQGKRIKDMTFRYICDGREIDFSNPIHVMGLGMDLSRAMDLMDLVKAREILDLAKVNEDKLVQIYRNEFALEDIFVTLLSPHTDGDIDKLLTKEVLQYMKQLQKIRSVVLRLQYALAKLHEKDEEKAENIYARFEKVCKSYYVKGEAAIDRELIKLIKEY